jgi:serine/threonine-protein kinase
MKQRSDEAQHRRERPPEGSLVDAGTADTRDGEAQGDGDGGEARSGVHLSGTLMGAYSIIKLLGEGGMGRVYLAEHTRLGRKVAIKALRSDHTRNPDLVRRFFHEAQSVNQINHEHIVEITDFVEEEGGAYYIMELLKGQTLAQSITEDGALPLARLISISIQACEALGAVHEHGIVHRDLKPDNIFLTERWGQRDFVKLLDFGVAKLLELGEEQLSESTPGAVLGTPAYMSPEQASGKEVDRRSDIYSMGVILYEMVTGRKPFRGKSYGEMVIQHLSVSPTPPSKIKNAPRVPPLIDSLIMKCLAKNPDDRPQRASELISAMVELARVEKCAIEQFVPTVYTAIGPPKRLRLAWIVGGGVAIAVAAAIAGVVVAGKLSGGTTTGTTAPAAAVQAPPPDAAPAKVRVAFESIPAGAEVVRLKDDTVLGKTPLERSFDREDRDELFEFRLADHQYVRRRIGFGRDTQVSVDLAPLDRKAGPRRRRPHRAKTRRKSGPRLKGGTIDPFNNPYENRK